MNRAFLPLAVAAVLMACSDGGDTTAPEDEEPLPADARVEEFGSWDATRWEIMHHNLGRGRVDAANLAPMAGAVELRLPAGTYDGAEFRSRERLTPGVVEARLKASPAAGSVTALFLYEGVPRKNDEVDIELLGGTRTAMFTVWQDGIQVVSTTLTLPFDPSAGFHDYRITWTPTAVRWRVDGVVLAEAERLSLTSDLHLYVNAWWPTWLEGGPAGGGVTAVVERLVY